ncbi:MAG: type I methionyl aminopeptidase [Actinomycetota bacterium]|nr:type I methionyl aminopeptidase [Actinomycetota bacterium]
MIICKSPDEIKIMEKAGKIVGKVLLKVGEIIKPGITSEHIDRIAEEIIKSENAIPAFKGYRGRFDSRPYPSSVCVSINEEVVHGIPGKRIIRDGDLVSVDVGAKIDGFYGDAARTFKVGRASGDAERLWKATKEALEAGIEKCRIGNRLSDISHAVESSALRGGFSVVKDFVGHGIGREMHEDPQILNYGPPGQGPVLKEGMVLAIEPMLNLGGSEVRIMGDGWTVTTSDGALSCHFENTVALCKDGPKILTEA